MRNGESLVLFIIVFLMISGTVLKMTYDIGYHYGVQQTQIQASEKGFGTWEATKLQTLEFKWGKQ